VPYFWHRVDCHYIKFSWLDGQQLQIRGQVMDGKLMIVFLLFAGCASAYASGVQGSLFAKFQEWVKRENLAKIEESKTSLSKRQNQVKIELPEIPPWKRPSKRQNQVKIEEPEIPPWKRPSKRQNQVKIEEPEIPPWKRPGKRQNQVKIEEPEIPPWKRPSKRQNQVKIKEPEIPPWKRPGKRQDQDPIKLPACGPSVKLPACGP